MFIIADWRRALRGYSFWSGVFGLLTFLIPTLAWSWFEIDLDPVPFGWAAFGFYLFGLLGRFVTQPDGLIRNAFRIIFWAWLILIISIGIASRVHAYTPAANAAGAFSEDALLEKAIPLIRRWEGLELKAYQDQGGVWTICSGATRNVYKGMTLTPEQCTLRLKEDTLEHWRGVRAYLNDQTLAERLTLSRASAWTSFAFNVGVHAAGKSTATRRLNAGNIPGACEALTWWNRIGKHVSRGLTRRRTEEYSWCMEGL